MRLLRTTLGLFVINVACLVLIIATHYSESAWDCIRYSTSTNALAIFDSAYSVYFNENERHIDANGGTFWSSLTQKFLMYQYVSPKGMYRLGIVDKSHPSANSYVEFPSSQEFFVVGLQLSPNLNYLPILAYDQNTHIQTMTIYDTSTLQPRVSAVQPNLIFSQLPTLAYNNLSLMWSPTNQWVVLISPPAVGSTFTLLSPTRNLAYSFPLSGYAADARVVWSPTERAIAISNEREHVIKLFTTPNDDWKTISTYNIEVDGLPSAPLDWSADGKTFNFLKAASSDTPYEQWQPFAFRLEDQHIENIEPTEVEHIDPSMLRLNDQWSCQVTYQPSLSAILTSTTHNHAPLTLYSDRELGDNECNPIRQAPDKTKLVLAARSSTTGQREWIALVANSPAIIQLSLPTEATRIVAWSPDSRNAFFFVPIGSVTQNGQAGQLGILDTTTWQWKLIEQPIVVSILQANVIPVQYMSLDNTRFVALAADRQHILLFDTNGNVLSVLPSFTTTFNFDVAWSPSNTKFMITRYDVFPNVLYTYTRDGQPLKTMTAPSNYAGWPLQDSRFPAVYSEVDWSQCEPSLKLPAMELPQ